MPEFVLSRALYLRALAVVHAIAFASFGVQVRGLIGAHGIVPANEWITAVREQLGGSAFLDAPTIFWWGAPNWALVSVCAAGVIAALLLFVGFAPRAMIAVLWALYLSLISVGAEFLSYQWDLLLLEASVMAFFLAPGGAWPERRGAPPPARWALALQGFLVFKLMVLSGIVKLQSGDPTWRHFTALDYHFWTQPLPTPLAVVADRAPELLKRAATFLMFGIELVVPWLIFFGRWPRRIAAAALVLLQVMIASTGNYGFFNLLTAASCIPLVDDGIWRRAIPNRLLHWTNLFHAGPVEPRALDKLGLKEALFPVAGSFVLVLSIWVMASAVLPSARLRTLPFESINTYGLFAVMTTTRPEIQVEGSVDGQSWRPYVFRFKPGPVDRMPAFVAPYQPRLDWQMWFAALGSCRQNPWFLRFQYRLLTAEPSVLELLETDPFHGERPKFVRAQLYQYRSGGHPWTRSFEGPYCPTLTLQAGHLAAVPE